jgi:bifunctional ADP-heptose synthase (sugar kinase/adenylyltransferase)
MPLDAASLIAPFAGLRILVIGDLMLDEFIWGRVSRISPEAPVPVVDVTGGAGDGGPGTDGTFST